MARPKGYPKSGGRQKGTGNKATAKLAAEVAKSGKTPLQFLLDRMRNAKASMAERIECAKAAAPYVHPKLASIEHKGKDDAPAIKHNHMIEAAHYDQLIGKLLLLKGPSKEA